MDGGGSQSRGTEGGRRSFPHAQPGRGSRRREAEPEPKQQMSASDASVPMPSLLTARGAERGETSSGPRGGRARSGSVLLHTGGSQTPLPPCRRVCSLSTEGRGSGGACSGLRRAKSQNASGDLPPAIVTTRSGCRLHHHHLSALLPPGNSERGCGRAGRQLVPQRGEGASWPGGERAGSQPQRHGGG